MLRKNNKGGLMSKVFFFLLFVFLFWLIIEINLYKDGACQEVGAEKSLRGTYCLFGEEAVPYAFECEIFVGCKAYPIFTWGDG